MNKSILLVALVLLFAFILAVSAEATVEEASELSKDEMSQLLKLLGTLSTEQMSETEVATLEDVKTLVNRRL